MIPRSEWKWFGKVGHLIVGPWCRFHLCTQVGPYFVSTVGEYVPDDGVRDMLAEHRGNPLEGRGDARFDDWMKKCGYEEIGAGRKYETMVFLCGSECAVEDCNCGIPVPTDWQEIDASGYNSPRDAHEGHYSMCEKYAAGVE